MGITLKGKSGVSYEFEGPYVSTEDLEDRSGVYAILCERYAEFSVLDVGEASEMKSRVENHDRKDCWEDNCPGIIRYAVYYIEYGKKPSRMEVEKDIRDNYDLPCGNR